MDSAEPCLFLFFPSAFLVFLSSGDDDVQDVLDLIIFDRRRTGGQDGGLVKIECMCASWSLILWIKAVELSLK